MRAMWTLARFVVLLAALATLLVTPLFVSSPAGTSIETSGAFIDAVAIVAVVLVAWSLWRDRGSLF